MKPYNPLEKENLGKSVTQSLVRSEPSLLASLERFSGAGVYALYYTGKFPDYTPFLQWNNTVTGLHLPIYVGKAIPTGGRKGINDPDVSAKGSSLFARLDEHRKSLEQVTNLSTDDFWCRYLVVDDIWIPLGESLLIQHYRPLWNSVLDGFGNHDPGAGRHKGARPNWDTLHPGRPWAERCATSKVTKEEIQKQIARYFEFISTTAQPEADAGT